MTIINEHMAKVKNITIIDIRDNNPMLECKRQLSVLNSMQQLANREHRDLLQFSHNRINEFTAKQLDYAYWCDTIVLIQTSLRYIVLGTTKSFSNTDIVVWVG